MATTNNSIPMMVNLLQELHENKEVVLSEFHYGENYKQVANDLYNTVKLIGGYGVDFNDENWRTVITIR